MALVIIIWGILIRLLFINAHTFWYDEAVALAVVRTPFADIPALTASYNWTPLFALLLKPLLFVSEDYLAFRLFSLVIGSLSLWLTYRVISIWNRSIALLTTVFMMLSPLQVYFSVEVREYALLVLEALSLTYFYKNYLLNRKFKYVLGYIGIGVSALYTHFYAGLILLPFVILGFWKERLGRSWILINLYIFSVFLPWLFYIKNIIRPPCWCMDPVTGVLALISSFSINGMGSVTFYDILYKTDRPIFIWHLLVSVFFVGLFIIGAIRIKHTQYSEWLAYFFLPLISVTLIGFFQRVFSPRAFIFLTPWFFAIISFYITSRKEKAIRYLLIISSVLLLISILVFQYFQPFFHQPFPD